jgi:hypothetical protein
MRLDEGAANSAYEATPSDRRRPTCEETRPRHAERANAGVVLLGALRSIGLLRVHEARSWPGSDDLGIAPKSAAVWGTPDVLPHKSATAVRDP